MRLNFWPFSPRKLSHVEERTTTADTIQTYVVGRPQWATWDTALAISDGYKASSWIYACITALMNNAASVPWKGQRQTRVGAWEDLPETEPLSRLLERPNPYQSWGELISLLTAFLYLGGNGFLTKHRAGISGQGQVVQLGILPAQSVAVVPHQQLFISAYQFNRGDKTITIPATDILHFRFPDPSNFLWGTSPVQAGSKAIDTDIAAVDWNKQSMANRTVPDLGVSFKEKLSKDQWEQNKAGIIASSAGATHAHKTLVLSGDAVFKDFTRTAVELDFVNSRKMTREEICALFRVPPPIVGLYENATLANIETARKIFWLDTMLPYLRSLAQVLNMGLAPEFGDDIRIVYDASRVDAMFGVFKERVEVAARLWAMGVPFDTINTRLDLGFDAIPGGNQGMVAANTIPVEAVTGGGDTDASA